MKFILILFILGNTEGYSERGTGAAATTAEFQNQQACLSALNLAKLRWEQSSRGRTIIRVDGVCVPNQ